MQRECRATTRGFPFIGLFRAKQSGEPHCILKPIASAAKKRYGFIPKAAVGFLGNAAKKATLPSANWRMLRYSQTITSLYPKKKLRELNRFSPSLTEKSYTVRENLNPWDRLRCPCCRTGRRSRHMA